MGFFDKAKELMDTAKKDGLSAAMTKAGQMQMDKLGYNPDGTRKEAGANITHLERLDKFKKTPRVLEGDALEVVGKPPLIRWSLAGACIAECAGTFFLVFFGLGAVCVSVLTGALQGLWQVAVIWGIIIALAVYACGAFSGAHFNPAVTLAFAAWRSFPPARILPYAASQLLGGFLAAALLYVCFGPMLEAYEAAKSLTRGAAGSQLSAVIFAEYFPHPLLVGTDEAAYASVGPGLAMLAEGAGTAILLFFIFALTDQGNPGRPPAFLLPPCIGLTVAVLICLFAPVSQAGFNPARDFAPRFFAYLAGWGEIAIPGPRGAFFYVYILSPLLGGLAGGFLYGRLSCGKTMRRPFMREKPCLILLGGFLGAGKTTLMRRAAELLAARGRSAGVITNDQAPELVDTRFLQGQGLPAREVAGSCFCCDFNGLIRAMRELRDASSVEALLAEPVGSCTDLSATIMQPLKDKYRREFSLAKLSVLLDPLRLASVFPDAPVPGGVTGTEPCAGTAYILRKQMEEADILLINKTDLLRPEELKGIRLFLAERFPQAEIHGISALTGAGTEDWLKALLRDMESGELPGKTLARPDYDLYAQGEAALGWLNAKAEVEAAQSGSAPWADFAAAFLRLLEGDCAARLADIGHVKMILSAGGRSLMANSVRTGLPPFVRGELPPAGRAETIINARVEMPPEELEKLVRTRLAESCAACGLRLGALGVKALSPARPQPTWRYESVAV